VGGTRLSTMQTTVVNADEKKENTVNRLYFSND
jgi:hypothetical protein